MNETETTLERAIETETPMSFRYAQATPEPDADPPPRRTVSPYELREGRNGKTLLVCWSHGSEAVRCFDTSRVEGLRSEAETEDFVNPVERD